MPWSNLYLTGYLTDGTANNRISVANIASKSEIPTKTSQLTNDSDFVTSAAIPTNYVTTDTYQTITGKKVFTGTLQAASLTDGTTTKTMTEVLSGGNYTAGTNIDITNNVISAPNVLPLSGGTMTGPITYNQPSEYGFPNTILKINEGASLDKYITYVKNSKRGAIRVETEEDFEVTNRNSEGLKIDLSISNPSLIPTTSSPKYNLGDKTYRFNNLYCNNLSDGTTTKTMTEVLSGTTEEWTFTLSDGTTVTKNVKLG